MYHRILLFIVSFIFTVIRIAYNHSSLAYNLYSSKAMKVKEGRIYNFLIVILCFLSIWTENI